MSALRGARKRFAFPIIIIYPFLLFSQTNENEYIKIDGLKDEISTFSTVEDSVTGNIDIRALLRPATWRPKIDNYILAKADFNKDNCFQLWITSAGRLSFRWYPAGISAYWRGGVSSARFNYTNNSKHYIRATVDFFSNDGNGPFELQFYTSEDGFHWDPFGNPIKGSNGNIIHATDQVLKIGGSGGVAGGGNKKFKGDVFWLEIRDGIDGAIVHSFDASKGDGTHYQNVANRESWLNDGGTQGSDNNRPTIENIVEAETISEDFAGVLNGPLFDRSADPDTSSGDTLSIVSIRSQFYPNDEKALGETVTGLFGKLTAFSDAPNSFRYTYELANDNGQLDYLRSDQTDLPDTFHIIASDSKGAQTEFSYTARVHGTNDPPNLSIPVESIPGATVGDQSYQHRFAVSHFHDPDGIPGSFSWILFPSPNPIPDWLSFDGLSGTISLAEPIPPDAAGSYFFAIGVLDLDGAPSETNDVFTFNVASLVNQSPVLSHALTPPSGMVGIAYHFELPSTSFIDDGLPSDPGALSWSIEGTISDLGLSIVDNGPFLPPTIKGIPSQAGSHSLTLVAFDGELSESTSFIISIAAAPPPPEPSDQGGLALTNTHAEAGSSIDLAGKNLVIENKEANAKISFKTAGLERMTVTDSGAIGIGVSAPNPESLLTVDGLIFAQGIVLRAMPADFVFEDGYQLLKLDELRDFIEANHHLPGVPAGPEMQANGVSLVEYNQLLLQKIEELTLYLLDKDKRLSEIRTELEELKNALLPNQSPEGAREATGL